MNEKLEHYLKKGYKDVEGWIYPYMMECVCDLSEVQKANGIKGNMCEIGLHRGRFFILLNLLAEKDEFSIGCDLFERQRENIGQSGHGNKEIVIDNLKKSGADISRVELITKNSLNLSAEELSAHGKIRMISVDGGHEAGTAYNDLKLASQTLVDGGIIWLDDFPREDIPGVMEGLYRFMFDGEYELWPIAIMDYKLILTNNEKMADLYIRRMYESMSKYYDLGFSIIVGKRVVVTWEKNRRTKLKIKLRQNKLWVRMKKYRLVDEIGKVLNKII